MAQGDITYFHQFYLDESLAIHNLNTNDVRLGLVTNAVIPTAATPDPRWGAGGSTNFAAQQVTPGGNYVDGGAALANTCTLSAGIVTFTGNNVSWVKNAGNPTDAFWGILYNFTAAGKQCIGFVELAGPIDMTAGDLNVNWNASGISRKSVI